MGGAPDGRAIAAVGRWLREANHVAVLSGAGVSAESGVPTFRGDEGLWRKHDPMQLATPEAFHRDPRGVWAWYRWRQALIRRCEPNAGHVALAQLERAADRFLLATQNVDGLHAAAGSRELVELHGNIFADRCTACGSVDNAWEHADVTVDPSAPDTDPDPPRCGVCGGLMRPGVVWFGESLPEGALERAADAAAHADVLLVVGTSGVVYPAAGLSRVTARSGGRVVVINPNASPHDEIADVTLSVGAATALPAIVEAMEAS